MSSILIVDDNRIFRQTLKEILSAQLSSINIVEAGDSKDAREKIENEPPDMIFMDVALPGENGLQLTKKIRKKHPKIPIVILTNYDTPEYREAAKIAGAEGFLSKRGATPQEIVSAAKSTLSSGGAISEET